MLSEATSSAESAEPSDAELIAKVRAGESDAYGELFGRHHGAAVGLAHRYARNASDAEDLAAEGFANVLAALQSGSGPDAFFRAYLLSSIARLAARKNIGDGRQSLSDDMTAYETPTGYTDPVLQSFESKTVADSFRSLPERWQAVLWYTEIDAMTPAAVAPLLGLSANGVSALAVRAREGLRQAYLQHHITATVDDPDCAAITDKLGSYARNGLSPRNEAKVREHLEDCNKCMGLFFQVQDVGAGMRGIIFPLAAGLAFPAAANIAAGGIFGGAVLGIQQGASRSWEWVRANALLSGSAASVAAIAVVMAVVAGQIGGINAGGAGLAAPGSQVPGNSRSMDGADRSGPGGTSEADGSPTDGTSDAAESEIGDADGDNAGPGSGTGDALADGATAHDATADGTTADDSAVAENPSGAAPAPVGVSLPDSTGTAGGSPGQSPAGEPAPQQPAPQQPAPQQPAPAPAPPPAPAQPTLFSATASVSRSGSEPFTDVVAISLAAVTGGTVPTDVTVVLQYHGSQIQPTGAGSAGWQCSVSGRRVSCSFSTATAGTLPPLVVTGLNQAAELPDIRFDIGGTLVVPTSGLF